MLSLLRDRSSLIGDDGLLDELGVGLFLGLMTGDPSHLERFLVPLSLGLGCWSDVALFVFICELRVPNTVLVNNWTRPDPGSDDNDARSLEISVGRGREGGEVR